MMLFFDRGTERFEPEENPIRSKTARAEQVTAVQSEPHATDSTRPIGSEARETPGVDALRQRQQIFQSLGLSD